VIRPSFYDGNECLAYHGCPSKLTFTQERAGECEAAGGALRNETGGVDGAYGGGEAFFLIYQRYGVRPYGEAKFMVLRCNREHEEE
jgi:hypothetical protein